MESKDPGNDVILVSDAYMQLGSSWHRRPSPSVYTCGFKVTEKAFTGNIFGSYKR